jgi:hypothetical protein
MIYGTCGFLILDELDLVQKGDCHKKKEKRWLGGIASLRSVPFYLLSS